MLNPPNAASPPQPSDSGSFTIGTTIPIAWQLQDAANAYISNPATLTSIVEIPNPACAGQGAGAGTTLYNASTGQAAFTYDSPNNRFVFNWNTTTATAGCYNLVVTTNDTAQWSTIVHLSTDTFAGFDAPLTTGTAPANPSNAGTFDAGSTIPVMFELNIPGVGNDTAQNVTLNNVTVYANAGCSGAPPSGAASIVLYDGGTSTGSFAFEPTDAVYTVNWATGAAPVGCYNIVVRLSDQSVYASMVTLAAPGGVTTLLQYNFGNVPQGAASVSAPPSFAAPNISGGTFTVSNAPVLGINGYGCMVANCIDVNFVVAGSSYNFAITNNTTISGAAVSFHEFNNDCQNGGVQITACNTAQSFSLQYDTDPNFITPVPTTVANFTPPSFYAQISYTLPISGTLPAGTYYFRIIATGNYAVDTAQYTFDNITITGAH
jgi:hypothetical protein